MNLSSGAFFKDIRKIKKNNTVTLSMTSKNINSVKDIGKVRSSEKINTNKHLEVKFDKGRIKMIK